MKYLNTSACILILFFILQDSIFAQGWRGIIPLRAARSDVERILGVKSSGKDTDTFELQDWQVVVFYTIGNCESNPRGTWAVPDGTVFRLLIKPKKYVSISDLNIDLSDFETRETDAVGQYSSHNKKRGENIETSNRERVELLWYVPLEKDQEKKCTKQRLR